MIQPDAILQQARQGMVPPDWQVIHGKRASAFFAGCFATFFTLVLLVILGIFVIVLIDSEEPGPDFLSAAGVSYNPSLLGGGAVIFALAVGVVTGLIVARDAGDPKPLLVIMPTGFIEYVSHRKPIISIPFAELADVDLRVRTTRSVSTNPSTGVATTTTRTHIWLDLLYRNGQKQRWQPRARFGSRLDVCQAVVKAHSRFMGAYGRG